MRKREFTAEILTGHTDDAVEVPFDPSAVWHVPPRPVWRGRRGHPVFGTLNGFHFEESFIVPRARKFFLIVDKEMEREAGVGAGDMVRISIEPKKPDKETR